jgi:PAS domain S-box-containing protein
MQLGDRYSAFRHPMNQHPSPILHGTADFSARLNAVRWEDTPLGAVADWPESLRIACGICSSTPIAAVLVWSEHLITFYNDACAPVLGARHPDAFGRPAPAVWGESWHVLGPAVQQLLADGGPGARVQVPPSADAARGDGAPTFSWSLAAVPSEGGSVGGVLCLLGSEAEQQILRDALAESRRRLEAALIAGEVGSFEWDIAEDRLRGDANFARILGVSLDATGAAPISDFLAAIHPDDRALVEQRLRHTLETGGNYAVEYRIISGGAPRWVVARGKVERSEDGRLTRFPGVVIDVTDRRLAEEAMRQSEIRYRTLFESIEEGFCILEVIFEGDVAVDYRFIESNRAFEKHSGLSNAQGRTARELLPDLEEYWFETYGRVARTGEPVRFESGSDVMGRWFDVFAFPIDGRASNRVALLFSDVSEQKRTEAALRESRERFRAILENSLDAAYRRDLRTDSYDYVSPTVEAVLGIPADVIRTMPVAELVRRVHPDDRPRIEQAMAEGAREGHGRIEYRFRTEGGGYQFVADHFTVQKDGSGEPLYRTGVVRNVTDAKLAEEELLRTKEVAEKASLAKSQFLAVMSHELRTPLAGVIGFADLLENEVLGPVNAQQRESLARIKASSWHLVSIIDDILTISRAEAGKEEVEIESVDLSTLTREVARIVEPQAESTGLELRIDDAGPLPLRTDPRKVRQILINLIGNAVKYGRKGTVAVTVGADAADAVFVKVTDNGPGIRGEDLDRIFEPFTQVDSSHSRRGSGVGLGLAISRRLARLLGGDVLVISTPGQGSTFTLRLPRA